MPALTIFVGKAWYSGAIQGWSEFYYLAGTTVTAAKANLKALVDARIAMLHESIECDYASISQLGVNRDSYLVQPTSAIGALTADEMKPNKLSDALFIRQETTDGHFANRYLHGIPDKVIINEDYVADTGAGSFSATLASYLTALAANAGLLKRDRSTTPATLTVLAISSTFNRGATSHKVGRPFVMRRGRRNPG